VGHGENFGGITLKSQKNSSLKIDRAGTKRIRLAMASQKSVKITINVDADSLAALKAESEKTGIPYQRLLNSVLRERLKERKDTESRLDKLERELERVKRKLAA
jgi:predicted DNA binding CopG/RHH family protein